jgi:AcrR family transcriptional regulator
MSPEDVARKLGRPPASSSADRRERIVEVAIEAFAELGWEMTTNKVVAAKAGITSGALYHYFDSKLDMFLAAHSYVLDVISERFAAAMTSSGTFAGQFGAVLEAAYELNCRNPMLARFLGSSRVDLARHEDLWQHVASRRSRTDVIATRLVDSGVATGEIDPSRRAEAAAFIRTTLVGLTDAVSSDLTQHRAAIDGVRALLDGELLGLPLAK